MPPLSVYLGLESATRRQVNDIGAYKNINSYRNYELHACLLASRSPRWRVKTLVESGSHAPRTTLTPLLVRSRAFPRSFFHRRILQTQHQHTKSSLLMVFMVMPALRGAGILNVLDPEFSRSTQTLAVSACLYCHSESPGLCIRAPAVPPLPSSTAFTTLT